MTQAPLIDPAQAARIAAADVPDAFATLGAHPDDGAWVVRAHVPGAEAVALAGRDGGAEIATLEPAGAPGLFAARLAERPAPWRLRARRGGDVWEIEDPYQFGPVLGAQDEHYISEGAHMRLWERLGAHPTTHEGVAGVAFAVWAPSARRVSVVGAFNDWDGRRHLMRPRGASGIWEIFAPGVEAGALYKYEIMAADGRVLPLKADPVGFGSEHPPATASIVRDLSGRDWRDGEWLAARAARQRRDAPISIYETHLPSWRRAENNRPLSYHELADQLVPYVRDMGFTHIEALPVSEYPFDGSWGYQPVGLYAPTIRHGAPGEFRDFVEACHAAGIGLILDWVPAHFPVDPHGLAMFDGQALYEHADPREGFHPDWNTAIYNYGRREVSNFLIANALYWLKEHHVDGLRVDAVASMLYRDYSRKEGEWIPNRYGGRENLEAVEFIRRMNQTVYGEDASVMTVAEESTAWPGVSKPVDAGGLGFGYKWNMGWMHDTLTYIGKDPIHRRHHHHQMTFGLVYAFSENFILPLSHDEVVHGKGSMYARMPGDEWQRFANLRAYYGFMWTHPGKKLMFMGLEWGQRAEWNADAALDWAALDNPLHKGVQTLIRDLNRLYRETPALHAKDCESDGFQWIEADAADQSLYAWARFGAAGDAPVLIAANFTPVPREGVRIGVPAPGRWREVLNTDAVAYGGSGYRPNSARDSEAVAAQGREHSLTLDLPPLGLTAFVLEK
ncbi:1,4-alpha-glucan branching protein GlgB [Rubrimonas cliftonensis]|uniref:1,4-alpha-glucan branching enzyme GlgB n=1 Tax=Rubrimonas cliftonensis TaxID=89524 RepID=A0A1H4ECE7_9RHOB|nr:1,4-alpha-glucan branching protein GlgB [Rubrimonas cliftonensis]SEA82507.1 1,4-alpha-glucan branching enzyme [Rubrimonas cliftonensis]